VVVTRSLTGARTGPWALHLADRVLLVAVYWRIAAGHTAPDSFASAGNPTLLI
jgi:hypothetical protein